MSMIGLNEEFLGAEQATDSPFVPAIELPRLIYPVSFLGAVKLDFMGKLAGALGSSYVDRDAVVKRRFSGQIRELPKSVGKTARKLLDIGDDVVIGENHNGRDDRKNLKKIARVTGATTICLSITSSEEVASRRVDEWVEAGVLYMAESGLSPPEVMQNGFKKHHTPSPGEADFIFELDGTLGSTYLLDRVFEELERHALMDEGLTRMDPRNLAS